VDLGAAVNPDEPMLREAKAPKAEAEAAAPAGTEAVAEEMIAAAEAPAAEAAAEEPPVADEAAQEATSEANDAVETEPAQV
jgi:small subunit ribosomal protein S2